MDSISSKSFPCVGRQQLLFLQCPKLPQPDGPVTQQPQRAFCAFDQGLAHGTALIVSGVIQTTISVKHRTCPSLMLENNNSGVFANDSWVFLSQIGVNVSGGAKKVSKDINEMHAGFMDQQARHLTEIGLAGQIGISTLTVTRTQAKRHLLNLAQITRINDLFDLAEPGLKPEILVDDEGDTGAIGGLRELFTFRD